MQDKDSEFIDWNKIWKPDVRVQNKLNLKEDTVIYEITNKETGDCHASVLDGSRH